jgi:uncharacterized membrane protein YdjX (TVP38/TMEM64 family)
VACCSKNGSVLSTHIGTIVALLGCQVGLIVVVGTYRLFNRKLPGSMSNYERLASAPRLFKHLDRIDSRRLLHLVFLLRVAPIVPFGLCNYFLAATEIPLMHLCMATLVGNVPGAIVYSFVGSSLDSLTDVNVPLRMRLLTGLIGLTATVIIGVYVSVLGKAALRSAAYEELTITDEEDPSSPSDVENFISPSSNKIELDNSEKTLLFAVGLTGVVALVVGLPVILLCF